MSLRLYTSAAQFRAACNDVRAQGGTLGLVPTMGALHSGHISLMHEAKRLATQVAATIFVNPTQFAANEDFGRYPRTLEADTAKCEAAGVDLLFLPEVQEMYAPGDCTSVRISGITNVLCGAVRPGHFDGVATIVTKLFVLAGTCTAVFGKKDYQQLKVIERVVNDLKLPIRIVGHPTLRESDGLAMSSRNAYLSAENRQRACAISRGLSKAWHIFEAGERGVHQIVASVRAELAAENLNLQYAELADVDTLDLYGSQATLPERALLAVAAYCDGTRLIDNIVLGEDQDPLLQVAPAPG
jgi:pantoate--beta-alanine ligase